MTIECLFYKDIIKGDEIMSVRTTYDDMRDCLRDELDKCLKLAKDLLVGEDIWGYDEMCEDYAIDLYQAVKNARDSV